MWKTRALGAMCAVLFTFVTVSVSAAFLPRLGGLAYYDDQLGITWTTDANINPFHYWQNHVDMAAALTLGGVTGWRLPNLDVNNDGLIVSCGLVATTQAACKDNEFGHFQHYGAGATRFGGITPGTPDPFTNLQGQAWPQTPLFWTSTEVNADAVWALSLGTGTPQQQFKHFIPLAGWYVHDGDVEPPPPPPSTLEVIDPNPDLIKPASPLFGDFTNTGFYEDLASDQARIVNGLAADGVTPLLLRWEVPGDGNVTFSIADNIDSNNTQDVGHLSEVEDPCVPPWVTQSCSTDAGFGYILSPQTTLPDIVTEPLSDGRHMAFAVLTAPIDFTRSSADDSLDKRLIKLTAEFTPFGSNTTSVTDEILIELHRPPVMLLHGLWSDAETWDWGLETDNRFIVWQQDYKVNNANYFRGNLVWPRIGVDSALRVARKNNQIAATKVDVIGHSMGGLLTRMYISETWDAVYKRPDNLFAGDVHKLISLNTPHLGSPMANLLVNLDNTPTIAGSLLSVTPLSPGFLGGGAVRDLRTDSPEIVLMRRSVVPAHSIYSIGGSTIADAGEQFFDGLSLIFRNPYVEAFERIYDTFNFLALDLQFNDLHDFVVGKTSQEGRVLGRAKNEFDTDFGTSTDYGVHFTVTKEERVSQEFINLLNTRLNQPPSPKFDAWFPEAPPLQANSVMAQSNYAAVTALTTVDSVVTDIVITTPSDGATATPGDTLTFTVQGINGYNPTRVLVLSEVESAVDLTPPFDLNFNISENALGSFFVTAYALDENGVLAESQPIVINIETTAALLSLRSKTNPHRLFDFVLERPVQVIGSFDDGIERDVSASSLGTTYNILDTSIAEVDSEGLITARTRGDTTLEIANSDVTTQVEVIVVDEIDRDGDGIPDNLDNCIGLSNAEQRDTDGDGYGNLCDGDLNDDGSTNTLDLNMYKLTHRTIVGDADYNVNADFNGDGVNNTLDLNIYKGLHRKPPGPSCCGLF